MRAYAIVHRGDPDQMGPHRKQPYSPRSPTGRRSYSNIISSGLFLLMAQTIILDYRVAVTALHGA